MADDSGWHRESWDVKSVPTEDAVQRRFTATDFLDRAGASGLRLPQFVGSLTLVRTCSEGAGRPRRGG